jgi:primosomal protein N' (replication factor Y)
VTQRLVSVAVPVPALGLLTYRVPDDGPLPAAGARVVVPLGPRKLTGVVIGEAEPPAANIELRDLHQVLDAASFVPADVVKLTEWVANYYLAGPGAALASALPPHALTGRIDAFKTTRVAALTPAGLDVAERLGLGPRCVPDGDANLPRLGTRQRDALKLLMGSPDGIGTAVLSDRGVSAATIGRLRAVGLVSTRQETIERSPIASAVTTGAIDNRDRALTAEQQAALEHLRPLAAANAFHVTLLHGVTGSGKTEVYLRLAEMVRQGGRSVLMLVPEIALTPQVAEAFRSRFGSHVAIQHSGLSDGERHDQWHRIRRGDVDVVIGTRSAVFAPIARLGLIIVDEEHDTSYKQEESPRYHGRDVAIMRAKFNDALVVLGSATPALETYANAKAGRYSLVSLDQRVLSRPMAGVQVINMRDEMVAEGTEVVLSRALGDALADRLALGEQSLILLNRRGFATAVVCRQCGTTLECPNCSVSLTVHTRGADWGARCHYCNFTQRVPRACMKCAAPYLERIGFGTERIEAEIRSRFPQARVARVDRDAIRRKGSLVDVLNRFARREIDVLVGTQMIAKGHDFPDVTLVGVISADVGLGLADFRAAERTFQLLTQVAGRAGRGERAGLAIIQSLVPEHYGIQLACAQDYRRFYEREIEFRRRMRYPPQVAMVNVVVRGRTFDQAMNDARDLADAVRGGKGFVILGPAPAPLTKLRGEHRAQFFLKGTSRAGMRQALQTALAQHPDLARRAVVDVDPLSML